MENILENIRIFRLGRGYSQNYMATQLAISQRAYSKIERGQTKLDVERMLTIAEVLEKDVCEIMNENNDNK